MFRVEKNLEAWLSEQNANNFPPVKSEKGESPYLERYQFVKKVLLPYQQSVEKEVLVQSASKWRKKVEKSLLAKSKTGTRKTKALLAQIEMSDPLIYLNNHGPGHVDTVITRLSELLQESPASGLTSYEGYLLLCATQFHDVGNIFGREEHERKCEEIMEKECKSIIRDRIERQTIVKIALVHGGAYGADKDVLSRLKQSTAILGQEGVRKRFLAALFRFADEISDDTSRADALALEHGTIPEESLIYHRYSEALHTVSVHKDDVALHFAFDSHPKSGGFDLALCPLRKFGRAKYLLDEIYDRTLKAECERRYCMRFLRPTVSIDRIPVEIVIDNASNRLLKDTITYTLEEKGYPNQLPFGKMKQFQQDIRTGVEERKHLLREWRPRA
jgi:hypothetical protein